MMSINSLLKFSDFFTQAEADSQQATSVLSVTEIKTHEDLIAATTHFNQLSATIEEGRAKVDAQYWECFQQTVSGLAPTVKAAANLREAIITYCKTNKDSLLDGQGKTVDLGTVKIQFREPPTKVSIIDEEAAIAELEAAEMKYCIDYNATVSKPAIKRLSDDELNQLTKITVTKSEENILITPKSTQIPF